MGNMHFRLQCTQIYYYSGFVSWRIRMLRQIDMDTALCYCLLSADEQCRASNLFRSRVVLEGRLHLFGRIEQVNRLCPKLPFDRSSWDIWGGEGGKGGVLWWTWPGRISLQDYAIFFVCVTFFNGYNKIILQPLLAHNIPFSRGGVFNIHSHLSHTQI